MTTTTIFDITTITPDRIESLNLVTLRTAAKELKVKNWWTMKKADLIKTVADIAFSVQNSNKPPEPKAKKVRKAPKTEEELENLVTIKELASEFGMKPAKARRILRSSFGLATTDGKTRWEWDKDSGELEEVRKVLSGGVK